MLLSMTGYGEARAQRDDLNMAVEVRAVNNRFLKINLRCPDPYHVLEAEIEKTVRAKVKRGTLQIQLQVRRRPRPEDFRLNLFALKTYAAQLKSLEQELGAGLPLGAVLSLPGIVAEPESGAVSVLDDWAALEPVLTAALANLQAMRQEEGRAMAAELKQYAGELARELERVKTRTPQVVANYRDRLRDKIGTLLREQGIEPDQAALVREVALFGERTDVAEEITRLASHIDQFGEMLQEKESPGRKLDFLIQEMVRETNTIGSKGNDLEVARHVVEMKSTLEKMRELVQNVE